MSNCYRPSYEIWIEEYNAAGLVSSLVTCFRWQGKFYCFDFPSPLIALPTPTCLQTNIGLNPGPFLPARPWELLFSAKKEDDL